VVLVKAEQAEQARKPMDWLRYAALDGEDANRLYGENPIETAAFQRVNAEARRHVKPITVGPILPDGISGKELRQIWREVVPELRPEAERMPSIRAANTIVNRELRDEAMRERAREAALDAIG
jgi:hypothetical protein